MINHNHISEFSQKLKLILDIELEQGNVIVETSHGWPKSDSILIILDKPFSRDYQFEDITFRNIDDRHYWKSEYCDEDLGHVLACRF